jgi:hypothetical protein
VPSADPETATRHHRIEQVRGGAYSADAAPPVPPEPRGYARSRAKADAIRAQLEPLRPDERPLGLTLAIALAIFIAVANLIGAAFAVGGESPAVGVVFALVMLALAYGVWRRVYLVILLYQAVLAISIILAALALALASNVLGALLALAIIGVSAPVFWLLVRVMARLQVPRG